MMKILAIETSCDETAVAVIDCDRTEDSLVFTVLSEQLYSQIELHREYGGVFPTVAKREHARTLLPLTERAFCASSLLEVAPSTLSPDVSSKIFELLSHYEGLADAVVAFTSNHRRPALDAIAVTVGPGLPPALWVGVSFAKALSLAWDIPIIPINHMEGHVYAGLASESDEKTYSLPTNIYPLLSLLISGGHTELVLSESPLVYKKVGQTLDDAVGEAFDKVARMLGLPYPGGPEISKLSEAVRDTDVKDSSPLSLPRPLLHDGTCNFSFSGLKTACMYALKKIPKITDETRKAFAFEFEEAVGEVLYKKTLRALTDTMATSLVLGGGVAANTHIRRLFAEHLSHDMPHVKLFIPVKKLTGDNAVMIAFAAYARATHNENPYTIDISANGNLSIENLTK